MKWYAPDGARPQGRAPLNFSYYTNCNNYSANNSYYATARTAVHSMHRTSRANLSRRSCYTSHSNCLSRSSSLTSCRSYTRTSYASLTNYTSYNPTECLKGPQTNSHYRSWNSNSNANCRNNYRNYTYLEFFLGKCILKRKVFPLRL